MSNLLSTIQSLVSNSPATTPVTGADFGGYPDETIVLTTLKCPLDAEQTVELSVPGQQCHDDFAWLAEITFRRGSAVSDHFLITKDQQLVRAIARELTPVDATEAAQLLDLIAKLKA